MKHSITRGILVLGFLILLSFSVNAAANFSAQNGYDWLAGEQASDGSYTGDVMQTALAIAALDTAGYDTSDSQLWLDSQLSSDYCYPTGACSVQDTSFAVIALNEVQDDANFESIEAWYEGGLSDADVTGDWLLEVVTSANGTCVVSYELEGTLKEVEVPVDGGVFSTCGNSHFLNLDDCLQAGLITANPGISLDVDCSDLEGNVVLAHVYRSSSTYYLLANENAAQATFQVNNGCYGKGADSACDIESSLYAGWALGLLESNVNTLVYLKEHYDSSDAQKVALLYLVTKDSAYLADLAELQKTDGSFDRDPFTTALAVLALSGSSEYSQDVEDAKSYLREEQSEIGDWQGNVATTAMVLYAAFGEEQVTPTVAGKEEEVAAECETDSDCAFYGDTFACDAGSCVEIIVSAGCTTDDDCDSGEKCIDDTCVESDCDEGQFCGDTGPPCCDYGRSVCSGKLCNENVYNCPSDCSCGDTVCDDLEQDASSGDEYYCPEDCEEEVEVTPPSTDEPKVEEGGIGFFGILLILLLLIGLGVGAYFAYKKGLFDKILAKFKKGGKGPVAGQPQQPYSPFTSRLPPQQPQPRAPLGGTAPQQPRRPY